MARSHFLLAGVFVFGFLIAACSSESKSPPKRSTSKKPVPQVASAEESKNQFMALCLSCHGETGKGDGPGAAGLTPKPRDFSDPEWQASVTDKHIETIILRGGASVGKSPAMPPQPQLKSKPALLRGLIAFIRGLKK